MVAEAAVWVDVESAVRAWARDFVSLAERRVFFGVNNNFIEQIVLHRVGGPDDACLVQFDCWSSTKAGSSLLAAELATAADALERYTHDETLLHGAAVESVRWFPDPKSDRPRHIVDVTFVASAAPAGS